MDSKDKDDQRNAAQKRVNPSTNTVKTPEQATPSTPATTPALTTNALVSAQNTSIQPLDDTPTQILKKQRQTGEFDGSITTAATDATATESQTHIPTTTPMPVTTPTPATTTTQGTNPGDQPPNQGSTLVTEPEKKPGLSFSFNKTPVKGKFTAPIVPQPVPAVQNTPVPAATPVAASPYPSFQMWRQMAPQATYYPRQLGKNERKFQLKYPQDRDRDAAYEEAYSLVTAWQDTNAYRSSDDMWNKRLSYTEAVAAWWANEKDGNTFYPVVPAAVLITKQPHNENTSDLRMHLTAEFFNTTAMGILWAGTLHLYINGFKDAKMGTDNPEYLS